MLDRIACVSIYFAPGGFFSQLASAQQAVVSLAASMQQVFFAGQMPDDTSADEQPQFERALQVFASTGLAGNQTIGQTHVHVCIILLCMMSLS